MITMGLADNRVKPAAEALTDSERIALMKSMFGYAGTYAIDGSRVTQDVQASWHQLWTGTKQVREVKRDGDRLASTSPPFARTIDGRMIRAHSEYARLPDTPVAENARLAGVWKLESWTREEQDTKAQSKLYGDKPSGMLFLTPGGHFATMDVAEKRPVPEQSAPNDAERIELMKTMFFFTGTYNVAGSKLTWHVDDSWNQNWTGRDMEREIEQQGSLLRIVGRFASTLDGKPIVVTTEYEKVG
jgi:hypothetical protein